MPIPQPLRLHRPPGLRRHAGRSSSSVASRPSPGLASSATPRPNPAGRLPPSPLLHRSQPPPQEVSEQLMATKISQISLGSWESQALEQGRRAGVDEHELRRLWADSWGRLMSGPSGLCGVTGIRLPQNLLVHFRPARLKPQDPKERSERMVLVPEGILHPDWSAAVVADNGIPPEPPVAVVCCDVLLERFLGNKTNPPRASQRQRLDSLPHSNFPVDGRLETPVQTPAGVTTVSQRLLSQVEHQLQERVLQEAFILAERVRAAGGHAGERFMRAVTASELDSLRADTLPLNAGTSNVQTVAFLDWHFQRNDMAGFFVGDQRRNTVPLPVGLDDLKPAQRAVLDDLPAFATCPQVDDVPFYALRALFPAAKLDLLVPLLDIIAPASAGTETRALLTSVDLLGEQGLDPFPLFRALYRLSLFYPHTFAWAPEKRLKLWHLAFAGRDEDLYAAQLAQEAAEALVVPRLKDGKQIDVRATLTKTSAKGYGTAR